MVLVKKGAKYKIFREIFYTIPEQKSDNNHGTNSLNELTVAEFKKIAKDKGLSGYSHLKKTELIELLSN